MRLSSVSALLNAALISASFAGVTLLAACQQGQPSDALRIRSETAATELVASIARIAQTCWFKSKDRAFASYRLANEVNSSAGRPRFLLVPKRDPGGLPLLVVQAEQVIDPASGPYTDLQTYGPALQSVNGRRITDDVRRWSQGDSSCT